MWAQYTILVSTAAIALFQLAKDWNAHQHHWRRVAVMIFVVLLTVSGIYNTHRSAKNAREQHTEDLSLATAQHSEDLRQIASLKMAVETANQNQTENTKTFVTQFDQMSKQLSDLRTQVRTEDLRKRVTQLQNQLAANIKAMQPPPKTTLAWSIFSTSLLDDNVAPITETTLVRHGDTVHADVSLLNRNPAEVRDVEFTIMLCDGCTFAKEPPASIHPAGTPEQLRQWTLPYLAAKGITPAIPLDITVPAGVSRTMIGMVYRCHTCATPRNSDNPLYINIEP